VAEAAAGRRPRRCSARHCLARSRRTSRYGRRSGPTPPGSSEDCRSAPEGRLDTSDTGPTGCPADSPASCSPGWDQRDAGTTTRARHEKAAQTRERIVAAGSDLVHGFETWNWRELTFKAVAERAGVGERTVYRHFPTERHLRDAVMQRLESEAGISYEDVNLTNLAETTSRVSVCCNGFRCVNRFPPRMIRRSSAPTSVGETHCCAPYLKRLRPARHRTSG